MKNHVLTIVLIFAFSFSWAQLGTSYGLKAGLNYNANGDYLESISATAENPDRNIGYHIGVFGKIGSSWYFRPELFFTSTKSTYNNEDFKMKKLDAPLLVGTKIIGPLSLFAGPAFQYIIDSDFEDINIDDVANDFTVGLNFGAAINFSSLAVDLRYERGFSNNEATFLHNNGVDTSRLDTRPDQFIISLSFVL